MSQEPTQHLLRKWPTRKELAEIMWVARHGTGPMAFQVQDYGKEADAVLAKLSELAVSVVIDDAKPSLCRCGRALTVHPERRFCMTCDVTSDPPLVISDSPDAGQGIAQQITCPYCEKIFPGTAESNHHQCPDCGGSSRRAEPGKPLPNHPVKATESSDAARNDVVPPIVDKTYPCPSCKNPVIRGARGNCLHCHIWLPSELPPPADATWKKAEELRDIYFGAEQHGTLDQSGETNQKDWLTVAAHVETEVQSAIGLTLCRVFDRVKCVPDVPGCLQAIRLMQLERPIYASIEAEVRAAKRSLIGWWKSFAPSDAETPK